MKKWVIKQNYDELNTIVEVHHNPVLGTFTTYGIIQENPIMDTKRFLKVKIKSLAEEARIIRLEERRAKARGDYETLTSLYLHRTKDVRNEARATQLAYGFLKGRTRSEIESPSETFYLSYGEHELKARTGAIVKKYGSEDLSKEVNNWYTLGNTRSGIVQR